MTNHDAYNFIVIHHNSMSNHDELRRIATNHDASLDPLHEIHQKHWDSIFSKKNIIFIEPKLVNFWFPLAPPRGI